MSAIQPEVTDPVWYLELGPRAWKAVDKLGIETIGDLLKKCVKKGEYVGLPKVKGAGTAVNYQISLTLKNYGFISDIDHVERTQHEFLPPNEAEMHEIAVNCSISLNTLLINLSWEEDEINFLRYHSGEILEVRHQNELWAKKTVRDFIINFIRMNNRAKAVFRTWGYQIWDELYLDEDNKLKERKGDRSKYIKLMKIRLVEWGVIPEKG